MKKSASVVFFAFLLSLLPEPSHAQVDMEGAREENVGALVGGAIFDYKNKTGDQICDFTFDIEQGCNVTITNVKVTATDGAGDWDVDDNGNGSLDAGEDNDVDDTPARTTRVAVKKPKDGSEAAPQDKDGKCIPKGKTFRIELTFSGNTAAACKIVIAPTNESNVQISYVPSGLGSGEVVLAAVNAGTAVPGVGLATVNTSGGTITGVEFEALGNFVLEQAIWTDPITDNVLDQVGCGSSAICQLDFSPAIAPGDSVSFAVLFNQMQSGDTSYLAVRPQVTGAPAPAPIPTLSPRAAALFLVLILGAGLLYLRRRSPGLLRMRGTE